MVDGTGQGVQLLQGHSESHPHVVGDQVPAGRTEETEMVTVSKNVLLLVTGATNIWIIQCNLTTVQGNTNELQCGDNMIM